MGRPKLTSEQKAISDARKRERTKEYNKNYFVGYYLKNKEKMMKTATDWYKDNKEVVLKRRVSEYQNNKERKKESSRQWRIRNPEKSKANMKAYSENVGKKKAREKWETINGRATKMFKTSKISAVRRKLDFNIEESDILWRLQIGVCQKTGIKFIFNDPKSPWKPSIDRIDSAMGYVKGNIQIVCWLYNAAKQQYADEDVSIMARAIVEKESKLRLVC